MRDFKFRSWDKFNENMKQSKVLCDFFDDFNKLKEGDNDPILMQTTGLKDKNGKEIYEGDILASDFPEDDQCYVIIIFEDGAFRKQYKDWDNTLSRPAITSVEIDILKLVVVGNIHETPDLIQSI